MTLSIPLDPVAERNAYRKSMIMLQAASRNFATARDQVVVDVRNALRSIRTARVALEIQRVNTELAQRRLEYANELLKGGSGQSRDVVEAQSSLLSAQDSFNTARAKLQVAVLQFLLSTLPGATLFVIGADHQAIVRHRVDQFVATHGIAHVEPGLGMVGRYQEQAPICKGIAGLP